jgi:hypothetical protein
VTILDLIDAMRALSPVGDLFLELLLRKRVLNADEASFIGASAFHDVQPVSLAAPLRSQTAFAKVPTGRSPRLPVGMHAPAQFVTAKPKGAVEFGFLNGHDHPLSEDIRSGQLCLGRRFIEELGGENLRLVRRVYASLLTYNPLHH